MAGFSSKPVRRTRWGASPSRVVGDTCDLLFITDLVGIRTEISAALHPGDELTVMVRHRGDVRSAVCETRRGETVGALAAFIGLARLLRCIDEGVRYRAIVQFASATRCSVEVVNA